jgi:hypothetical protein
MEQKAAAGSQKEAVEDAEHRVDRVWIARLKDSSAAGLVHPSSGKVATAKRPAVVASANLSVSVGIEFLLPFVQFDLQLKLWHPIGSEESPITTLQHLPELCIVAAQQYWQIPDVDYDSGLGGCPAAHSDSRPLPTVRLTPD